jgi:hypothetical protein
MPLHEAERLANVLGELVQVVHEPVQLNNILQLIVLCARYATQR